ncbi:MAG TPA: hypothetical protein VNU71_01665, partial [Burkholderiaceae bacterium]|nr:hypothetical protein [Burkholderiaceae bacterium]
GVRNTLMSMWLVAFVFQALPVALMQSRADADLSSAASTLPRVEGTSFAGDWRLLFLNGDVALVVRLSDQSLPRTYAFAKVTEGAVRIVRAQAK